MIFLFMYVIFERFLMVAEKLLTFVHISDTHLHADPKYHGDYVDFSSRPAVEALIKAINTLPAEVDLILHTGDVVDVPNQPADYIAAREVLGKLRYPVHTIPGNHDTVSVMQQHFLGRNANEITPHLDSAFEAKGVQFIMLDSNAGKPVSYGELAQEQLAWLDSLVSAQDDSPLVVGVHHHTLPMDAPWLDEMVLLNGLDLHRILLKARKRLRGVFYGHIHENSVIVRDGISYYSAVSGWFQGQTWHGQPTGVHATVHEPGFNLVTLTAEQTIVRFHRVRV
jgi:Icc protein